VVRGIFGPERDEVTREWRRLHNEELYYLHNSQKIIRPHIRNNEMGGACGTHEAEVKCTQSFRVVTCGKEPTWKTKK